MITITNREHEKRFRQLYETNSCTVNLVSHGRGTATSGVLDFLGLEATEKSVLSTLVTDETFTKLRRELIHRFRIDVPGTGIVFLIPLCSIGGKRQMSFLLGEQSFIKREDATLKKTDHELLVVITNQGYTEMVMDIARERNASGGTVIHARGTGMKGSEKFFGMVLSDKKECIYMVVRTETRVEIMEAGMA